MNLVTNILPLILLAALAWYLRKAKAGQAPLGSWLAAYRRGDYAAALQASEAFLKAGKVRDYWALRGGTLMQLGQFAEAEESLDRAVALAPERKPALPGSDGGGSPYPSKSHKLSALAGAMLVELYLEQSRYDDAVKRAEMCLRDWPGYGPFHAHIAEACLRRGNPPGEALKWAMLAVEEDREGRGLSRESRDCNLCENLTTLAWVVAASSKNRAQVDVLVEEAVELADGLSIVPSSAIVHFQSGLAYAALGDRDRCRQFWEKASRIDPQGRWGRSARAKLAKLNR